MLFGLLWVGVVAYIVFATHLSHIRSNEQKIDKIEIEIADNGMQGALVSADSIRAWIARSGIRTFGEQVAAVRLNAIEQLIAGNGFVADAQASVTYAGVLHITVRERRPLLRLLTDGYDVYVTDKSYIFAPPAASALYVPVVTGSYTPPFAADYTGSLHEFTDTASLAIAKRITALEQAKRPFLQAKRQNQSKLAALNREEVTTHWWQRKNAAQIARDVTDLQQKQQEGRRQLLYEQQKIQAQIDTLTARQTVARNEKKILEKRAAEFIKLLIFATKIQADDFWRSEIVQITAYTAQNGDLEVDLIPRSGHHTIVFGRLDAVESKFDKLLSFYKEVLTRVGWDEYREIDLRYQNQVVCRKPENRKEKNYGRE